MPFEAWGRSTLARVRLSGKARRWTARSSPGWAWRAQADCLSEPAAAATLRKPFPQRVESKAEAPVKLAGM
eukprot:scaffold364754_cov51-Prasinocladus_malaysianus.AAC.1